MPVVQGGCSPSAGFKAPHPAGPRVTTRADAEVLQERGAALAISGLAFLYLAFITEVRLRGSGGVPHAVSGVFIAYAVLLLLAGLGCYVRPDMGNRLAGASYIAGAWILGPLAILSVALVGTLVAWLALLLAAPVVVVLSAHGLALIQGQLQPAEEDPVLQAMLAPLRRLLRRNPEP